MKNKDLIMEISVIVKDLLIKYSVGDLCLKKEDFSKSLNELGVDSLMYVRLIVKLEKKYNIEFLEEDIIYDNLNTIEKIAEKVRIRMQG